ncbi:Transporter of the ATP-binding cassette (ABC) [Yamadazyma tenuis]|uniref:p-loop containing nucleoside triphosphate hydrolase protein n=1 Tax=Candida tenuis (strain ATCC 10573 / BCRC 21748 / CBS 615 / JCM 9827 / NBRC 10315 / NRRL Y-1498 / VKM Y-70) TaxID=590646 RepID=G3B4L8_CANTC|nr:P-loop containing nucleoside triphosphate hydrolase protein [Yamadazyma tenuis ATCC 10573]EGV63978.1 P-loop containing nucleoside triphosphate hydrolase protein [Yamadazyma tenuis ATCC 10573]WEJ96404.1 Transporter of the ATP-binding cassette (ABC) [Yamadazyma tenuis]
MVESLSCPVWYYDDITVCSKDRYFNYLLPLITLCISAVVLAIKTSQSVLKRRKRIQLTDESRPLLAASSGVAKYNDDNDKDDIYKDIKSKHFDLTRLQNTDENGQPLGHYIEVPKDTTEKVRLVVEYLILACQLGGAVVVFFVPELHAEFGARNSIVRLVYWAYLFAIGSVRIINISKTHLRLPSLFAHTSVLNFFNLFPALLVFRSVLVKSYPTSVFVYYVINFVLSVSLFLLNFTSRFGDKPASVYVTNDNAMSSPETTSSIFSFISYSWIDKLVWSGYTTSLKMDDIWSMKGDDYSLSVLKGFEAAKSTTKFSVKVFSHFKFLFFLQALYAVLESFLSFVPTLLLKSVLEYVADPSSLPPNVAWSLVILMPIVKIGDSLVSGCSLFLGRRVCVRMRSVLIGEVYAKALRRKITVSKVADEKDEDAKSDKSIPEEDKEEVEEEKKTAELGAIINLMAIDAFKVSEICGYLHFFTGSILSVFICLFFLYELLGWSALAGAGILICLLPINYKVAIWLGNLQKKMLAITDKRIQKLNETLQSIRIIKFFAWEDKFFESIMKLRGEEIHQLFLRCISWAISSILWFLTPTLITLISFYCYTIIEGNVLTAPIAFTSLSLFTLLRGPLDQLADMTALVIQSKVSLDRVGDFLAEDETSKYEQLTNRPGPGSPTVGFEKATFVWNKSEEGSFKLRDIDISFKEGQLNVIFGPTGSGKTSLLLALLGEMDLIEGKVYLPGIIPRDELIVDPHTGLTDSVAYCSQSAWLLNETIKNNIVFGASFNQDRYDKVIDACGLSRDLQILSAGDATEIGEKGITLSGGQKQRVSLARALYSNSKTILLDDCLSAVDSHTALWIYENCISGPLMDKRTCILVSHNVALTVQNADWVVLMENGRVKTQATPSQLLESGALGADDLVKTSVMNSKNQSSSDLTALATKEARNTDLKAKSDIIDSKLKALNGAHTEEAEITDTIKADGKLVEEEQKAEGAVSSRVYIEYLKFFGSFQVWMVFLFLYGGSQGVYIFQSWWLRKWSMDSENSSSTSYVVSFAMSTIQPVYDGVKNNFVVQSLVSTTDAINSYKEENSSFFYMIVYGIIGMIYTIMASGRMLYTFYIGIDASNRMFVKVLTTVLGAKLRFFDKTPIGRIMNRFSKDIEAVDQELTPFAEYAFICLVQCVSTLFLITFITPGFLFFAFLISFIYYVIGLLYISLSRELKRYESISKSPIHQHFSESLAGIATIRAYGVESRFMKQNLSKIDTNNKPFFYIWVANRWLSLRVDSAGALVLFCAGVFVLLSVGKIDAGLAGLSLTYAIAFNESALWIVRLYSNVEMNMNSVERLQEYFDIEQEPPFEIPETEPRSTWPEKGEIEVEDVSLRYAPELPRVIKNISFHVNPKNKIGIVGRTGAGKSTIITAFFRFLDPETGRILIDGVDICKIGLKNLRQAITIIPQDPTLFTGTIKTNLDPFDEYTEAQMFEALRRVNLVSSEELQTAYNATASSSSSSAPEENVNQFLNLESSVSEGGGNLSQGQRQLMCLARSLLRSPKVILLDEATASIDYESDAMIQQTIREEFSNSTILTIAHRLRSIVDYDKILVMDEGRVVEYDDPYTLIANKETLFHSMCDNSGELDTLTKLAKEAFVSKKNAQR